MPGRGTIHLESVSILFELVRQMAHARRYRREPFLDDLAYLLRHLTHHARRALRLGQSAPLKSTDQVQPVFSGPRDLCLAKMLYETHSKSVQSLVSNRQLFTLRRVRQEGLSLYNSDENYILLNN
jgi:hypothetical protein